MSKPFEPIQILRLLAEHHIDAIVVGGVAGTLAGSPLATFDLDLVYSLDPSNLERLVRLLARLEARYRDPAGRVITPDCEKLATIRVNLLETNLGALDLLRSIGHGLEYPQLLARSVDYDLDGLTVRAIDVETLIEAKAFADRPKDRLALPFLLALRDSEGRGGRGDSSG